MKRTNELVKIVLCLLLVNCCSYSYSQQIGDGWETTISNFGDILSSGAYNGLNPLGGVPDSEHSWQHLLVLRHPNANNNHQLQISTTFAENERIYFRKIASNLNPKNTNWIELATRNSNTFNGNQHINGFVGIATTDPRTFFDVGDCTTNTLKSVFARLAEGNSSGDGTYLGVKSYDSQGSSEEPCCNIKSFAIEHKFYGQLNSSINFYRGGGQLGGFLTFCTSNNTERMRIDALGNVLIGKYSQLNTNYKLDVEGKVRANEITVNSTGADFVFENGYNLRPLTEVEAFVKANRHLPDVAPASEMQSNGVSIGDMNAKLLQKVEELTLYLIEKDKEIKELKSKLGKVDAIEVQIERLKAAMAVQKVTIK